ncbi:hypothetical protein THAOC_25727, partial [Thalassiosira oceanica]
MVHPRERPKLATHHVVGEHKVEDGAREAKRGLVAVELSHRFTRADLHDDVGREGASANAGAPSPAPGPAPGAPAAALAQGDLVGENAGLNDSAARELEVKLVKLENQVRNKLSITLDEHLEKVIEARTRLWKRNNDQQVLAMNVDTEEKHTYPTLKACSDHIPQVKNNQVTRFCLDNSGGKRFGVYWIQYGIPGANGSSVLSDDHLEARIPNQDGCILLSRLEDGQVVQTEFGTLEE